MILAKYIDFNLWSIDPFDYDDMEKHIKDNIQAYGYSHSNNAYNGVLKSEMYIDTDNIEMIEDTFPDESNDIKKWLKLYLKMENRSDTIKNLLK